MKSVLKQILLPTGLAFPLLLILGLPALLWLWLSNPHTFLNYLAILSWTLMWADIPGTVLLNRIVPNLLLQESIGRVSVYAIPLLLVSVVIAAALVKKSVPKYRAIWLGFSWSVFVLQVLGTVPMAYLWARGV